MKRMKLVAVIYKLVYGSPFNVSYMAGGGSFTSTIQYRILDSCTTVAYLKYMQLLLVLFSKWEKNKKLSQNMLVLMTVPYELVQLDKCNLYGEILTYLA